MKNKLEIFNNTEFGSVRIIQEGDKYLFCGLDVAAALGYAKPRNAITAHCRYALKRGVPHPQAESKEIEMLFIPEGDVYRLITHSKLPSADRFEKWVFDEVLPNIRKHGVYITDEKLKLFAEHPELLDALMKSLYAAHAENLRHRAERQTLLPKADYYDAFMDADGCTNLRTTAKELNVPERWFARFLQQTGFLYRSPAGNLMPYAIPRNRGLFRVRDYVRNGHSGAYTLITPMGKSLFRELLRCGEAASN